MRPPLTDKQIQAKNKYLLKTYHITYKQYLELLKFQDHKCAICKKPENQFKTALAVDHSHIEPAEVRGLLCWKCNRSLGKFQDSKELLQNAAQYVTITPVEQCFGHKILTVPGKIGTKTRAKLLAKREGKACQKRNHKGSSTGKRKIVKRLKK